MTAETLCKRLGIYWIGRRVRREGNRLIVRTTVLRVTFPGCQVCKLHRIDKTVLVMIRHDLQSVFMGCLPVQGLHMVPRPRERQKIGSVAGE